jgi:hypothetical protein
MPVANEDGRFAWLAPGEPRTLVLRSRFTVAGEPGSLIQDVVPNEDGLLAWMDSLERD